MCNVVKYQKQVVLSILKGTMRDEPDISGNGLRPMVHVVGVQGNGR